MHDYALLAVDVVIHSLLKNSRRAPNFEFIRFLWMITSHKERGMLDCFMAMRAVLTLTRVGC